MKQAAIVAAIVAHLAVSISAADVSGVWSLRLTTADDESAPRASVTLIQNGEKLTGSCTIDDTDGEAFTVDGQATGNALAWRCMGKGPVSASFKATVNATGREMTGSWTTGAASGTFKGSKPAR